MRVTPRRAVRLPVDLKRVRWPGLAVLPMVMVVVRERRTLGFPRPLSSALAASAPLALALSMPRGRARNALVWAMHMWAYKVQYEIPYDRPERLRQRLRVEPPLRFDSALAGGMPPSQRLQARWRRPRDVNWLDRALTALYASWEAEPHIALALVLLRRPERFAVHATRQGATFDLTLLGYWLVPTAPPWWASEEQGLMGGAVQRVVTRVARDLRGDPLEQDDVEGANPWASMPSDHFAAALAAAFTLRELAPAAGAAGFAYAALLGFGLVYLGEHYVADLLAGAALAAAVATAEPLAAPAARRIGAILARFEP